MGKGDKRRSSMVSAEDFETRWIRIFGRDRLSTEEAFVRMDVESGSEFDSQHVHSEN